MEHHNKTTGVNFMITSTKRSVLAVTLSINNNIKFLEDLKQGFKRTIFWSRYRSKMTTQPKNNNLDCMIDPTFTNNNIIDCLLNCSMFMKMVLHGILLLILTFQQYKLKILMY